MANVREKLTLAVLLDELEGLDEADGLLDRATDGEVVDGDLTKGSLGVDEEETTEGNALVLEENTVVLGNLVVLVREEGKLEIRAEASLLAGEVSPSEMGAG